MLEWINGEDLALNFGGRRSGETAAPGTVIGFLRSPCSVAA
jgi:hypothetical protein